MAKHEEYLWKDPFDPSLAGSVLLSDQIHFLADEIGLIDPFDEKSLRPAAYDMRIGDSYYVDDKPVALTDKLIEIPPNGLVYVKTKEKFKIPYYLVARYSLRVHQVYRGLLIDNGLHIDPGYCGHIWIPVHNFTTQIRTLTRGEEFISVEFNRTTPLPKGVSGIKSEGQLVGLALQNKLKGSKGGIVKVFYKDFSRFRRRHDDFTPRLFWDKFPLEKHQSAMLGTELRLNEVKKDVESEIRALKEDVDRRVAFFRRVGILAGAGLIVGLLAILLPILYAEYGKSREAAAEQGAQIRDLRERLEEQKKRLDQMTAGQAAASKAAAPGQAQDGEPKRQSDASPKKRPGGPPVDSAPPAPQKKKEP